MRPRRRRKRNGAAEQTGVNYVIDLLPHLAASQPPWHLPSFKNSICAPPLPTANPSYINTTPDPSADLAALQGLAHPVKVSRLGVRCQSDIQLSSFGGELPSGLRLSVRHQSSPPAQSQPSSPSARSQRSCAGQCRARCSKALAKLANTCLNQQSVLRHAPILSERARETTRQFLVAHEAAPVNTEPVAGHHQR